jgi:LuxR family glucitol operon transcriptional activator
LTREYALAELTAHPDFELEARERWVRWYQEYADKYGMGGKEWEEWHIQYDRLEEEWENILAIFDWYVAEERYEDVKSLWKNVSAFASIYGHWDDTMIWKDWLIQAAERRGNWSKVVDELAGKGWSLTFMGHILEAQTTLTKALNLRAYAAPKVEMELFRALGLLCIRQGHLNEAQEWFGQAKLALQDVDLEEKEHKRETLSLTYWEAVIHFEGQNYDQAEKIFHQVLKLYSKLASRHSHRAWKTGRGRTSASNRPTRGRAK